MANPFRDMSVIMQGLVALAIAVVLVLAGLYVPGSPVAQERADLDALAAIAEASDDEELRCRVLFRRSRLAFNDYTGRDEVFEPLAVLRERARQSESLRWQAEADRLAREREAAAAPSGQSLAISGR